ncbi:TPA: trypsin-like peptidase domain-containing protein [Vibrio parahaemolyticus]|uniref:trypsin-like peptidase domain-containing protein n=1 Tax=Vibrio parahaemolyticus TaxID=670 RepID=UPI00111CD7AD|nr:trypsin-like peptidase domain-containing protein [Vibrio parahaemolyticus]TOG40890.1 hypothetical protein CGJ02_13985 [Vibrio parahaemolyticus]HCE3306193.1 trypsin-like peptidase domain-containing protein [Vibrio parahaemolyticus]HCG7478333.1 trypsin-like peptidase domain-containing protein [Vibrio parahaemolyticus]HCH2615089.1 trypsin-like peptidase domain-containing protein [Vibrio parahaemolyticus]HCM1482837.1 trypsin-like peptidase domain-containing protein [Vibrio parahaemolyticus]
MKPFHIAVIIALFTITISNSFAGPCLQNIKYDLDDEGVIVKELSQSVFLLERWSEKENAYIPLGTATVISKSGHLLTAKHLFEYANTANLTPDKFRVTHIDRETQKKKSFNVENIKHHKESDITIIKAKEWNKYLFKTVKLNFDFLAYPSKVKMYSYSLDNPLEALMSSSGSITRKDSNNFFIIDQIKPYNGQSGSLLINENIQGVGVLSGYIVDDGRTVTSYSELREQEFKFIRATSTHLVQDLVPELEMEEADELVNSFINNPGPLPDTEIRDSLKFNPLLYYLAIIKIVDEHSDIIGKIPTNTLASEFWFQFTSYSSCFLNTNVARQYSNKIYTSLPPNKLDSIVRLQINEARSNKDIETSIAYYSAANQLANLNPELSKRYWANLDYTALELAKRINNTLSDTTGSNIALASLVVSERIKFYTNIQHRLTNLQIDSAQQVLLSASQFSQAGESHYAGSQFALAASGLEKYRSPTNKERVNIIEQSEKDFRYHAAMVEVASEQNIPDDALIKIRSQSSQSFKNGTLPSINKADIAGAIEEFEINAIERLSAP